MYDGSSFLSLLQKKKHLFIGPFQFSSFSAHVFWAPILIFSFRTFHTDLLKENLLMCYCNLAVSLKGHWTNSWHWWKNLFHILSSYKCIVGKWGSSPPSPLLKAPTPWPWPSFSPFLKSLFPLPSFLLHPLSKYFRQFPPLSCKSLLH